MTRYNRGDVILVPFPFTDQTTTKKRPAIIGVLSVNLHEIRL
jgi:mRNA interferase MazF